MIGPTHIAIAAGALPPCKGPQCIDRERQAYQAQGGPAVSWPGEFGPKQSMCPPDLDQTCGASITCLFHKILCALRIWK
jgi:hypothetical protein